MLHRPQGDTIRGDDGYVATDIKKSVSQNPKPADLYEGVFRDIGTGAHNPPRPNVPFDIQVPEGFDDWPVVNTLTRQQLREGAPLVFVDLVPPRLP